MNITPIINKVVAPTASGAGTTGSQTKGSTLDMQTFMVLLSVQLQTQNPLEPMSDRDFFAQMAQLGTVQGMDGLKSSMDASQAAGMIGKQVTAVRPFTQNGTNANDIVQGTVKSVSVRDGNYYLQVEEANHGIAEIQLNNVISISAPS